MKAEDVKIGMKVVYDKGGKEEDFGVVDYAVEDNPNRFFVLWEKERRYLWVDASLIEPAEEKAAFEQKTSEQRTTTDVVSESDTKQNEGIISGVERVKKLASLCEASLQGKTIQFVDNGWWYDGNIKDVNYLNVHYYRVKPSTVTGAVRVGLLKSVQNSIFTITAECENEASEVEENPDFIRWLTEWVKYEVDVE